MKKPKFFIIAGLGNPGDEYKESRHNAGRMAVEELRKQLKLPDWEYSKNGQLYYVHAKPGKALAELILPETYMNKSGKAVAYASLKHKVMPDAVIVVHDDIDLPFGSFKVCFNRGTAGHNGVESVRKALKTKAFVRVRIGVCKSTPSGKPKKPTGEEATIKYLLSKFTKLELEQLKKENKKIANAIIMIVEEGRERAMGEFNQCKI